MTASPTTCKTVPPVTPDLEDDTLGGITPVDAGSIADRLSQWCRHDSLQREDSVLEALAHCREVLHALPSSVRPHDPATFEAGAVAVLVCEIQDLLSRSGHAELS